MNTLMIGKNIVVMGVANKWSIAWAIAKQLKESGANLIFTYFGENSERSIKKLIANEGIS
ncbi:MAG: SDR family oxidoreductase, partial [Clostridiales bacterium]|nr:SDR family oxidoreductase [Clostridiales bacterium]